MKVVQIGGALCGAQKVIEENIHEYIISSGNNSVIYYSYGTASMSNEICYSNEFERVLTRGLRKIISKNQFVASLQTLRLIRLINSYNPDLINLHVIHHGFVNYNMLLSYLSKKQYPVVYTMHDMWAFTGGCYHYSNINCSNFESSCENCPSNKLDSNKRNTSRELMKKKELLLSLNNIQIVAVSEWVGIQVKRSILSKLPLHVIHNGVDYPTDYHYTASENADRNIFTGKIRIISVASSWSTSKGIEDIYKLAYLLGSQYEICLVGNIKTELKNIAPANIIFYGFCSDKTLLYKLYKESDIHFSASKEETFGMTFIEAAYMGCRSVGYGSTAIKEILEKVHGVVVEELTVDALKEAICSTVENKRNVLSPSEIEEIRDCFSNTTMAKKYFELYKTTLGFSD